MSKFVSTVIRDPYARQLAYQGARYVGAAIRRHGPGIARRVFKRRSAPRGRVVRRPPPRMRVRRSLALGGPSVNGLVPATKLVKFHMCAQMVEAGDATNVGQLLAFKMNDPSDPNFGIAGTEQPAGWEQWNSFYGSYRVKAAKLKVTMIDISQAVHPIVIQSNTGISGGGQPPAIVSTTKWQDNCDVKGVKTRHRTTGLISVNRPQRTVIIWNVKNMPSFILHHESQGTNKDYGKNKAAMPDTSPAIIVDARLAWQLVSNAVAPVDIDFRLLIECWWLVEFSEPRVLGRGTDT